MSALNSLLNKDILDEISETNYVEKIIKNCEEIEKLKEIGFYMQLRANELISKMEGLEKIIYKYGLTYSLSKDYIMDRRVIHTMHKFRRRIYIFFFNLFFNESTEYDKKFKSKIIKIQQNRNNFNSEDVQEIRSLLFYIFNNLNIYNPGLCYICGDTNITDIFISYLINNYPNIEYKIYKPISVNHYSKVKSLTYNGNKLIEERIMDEYEY